MNHTTQVLDFVSHHLAWYNHAVTSRDFSGFTDVLHPDIHLQVLPDAPRVGRSEVLDALHHTTPALAIGLRTFIIQPGEIEGSFSWLGTPERQAGILHLMLKGTRLSRVTLELLAWPHQRTPSAPP